MQNEAAGAITEEEAPSALTQKEVPFHGSVYCGTYIYNLRQCSLKKEKKIALLDEANGLPSPA